MVWDVAREHQATEPAIGKNAVHLGAKPPLGANAEAVAENQHTHHQFRIESMSALH
jgi:hypothetical protein